MTAREDRLSAKVVRLTPGPTASCDRRLYMLVVPAQLDRVADVRGFIDSVELAPQLSPERIFDVKVAVSEAVANAIEHANAEVRLWVWLMWDRVVIEVMNRGDFGMQSDGQPSERRRGFGLKLMVSLADEVTFIGARKGSTKVRLTFSYPHAGHRPPPDDSYVDAAGHVNGVDDVGR